MFERKKSAGKIFLLPVDDIHPSPYQARTSFDEAELAGLAQSIRENGLLQPITVRKTENGYELVAGERRLRACKLAKMSTIPSILCDYSDHRTAALGLLENLQRTDLNPFEQAQGLRDVMVLWDCTQAEAAKRLGMAQPTLANKLRLLQLTLDQRQFILDNGLTERHRPLHRPAPQRHSAGQAPYLHGQRCPHLCEHHRPRHPPDDGQRRARHRPPRRTGRLYRIYRPHPHRRCAEVGENPPLCCSTWNNPGAKSEKTAKEILLLRKIMKNRVQKAALMCYTKE